MKDAQGRVIYVGKAKNLRSRASSYFHKTATDDRRICDWIGEVADVEFLAADSEVDALLMEARLVKDIQPKYNRDLKDDKTFPYLADHDRRRLSPGQFHPRSRSTGASSSTAHSRGPRACAARSRSCSGSSSSAPARWTSRKTTRAGGGFAPACWPRSTSAPPRATCGSIAKPTEATSAGSNCSLTARRMSLLKEMEDEMREASKALQFEKAARLRDEIKALGSLNLRGNLADHAQPEVFYVDPRKGLKGLKQILKLDSIPRTIDGVDIAHLGGNEMVGSLVSFVDGLPFKPGYRRYQIKSVAGIDDFAAIREVVDPPDQGPARARRAFSRYLADRRRQGTAQLGPGRLRVVCESSRRP